ATFAQLDRIRGTMRDFQSRMMGLVVGTAAIGLLLGAGLAAWLGTFLLSRPLRRVTGTLQQMAAGDYDVEIETRRSRDEVGAIWSATEYCREALIEGERLKAEQAEADARADARKRQLLNELADAFE